MTKMDAVSSEELFYTGPMALSRQTMVEVRKKLVQLIENVTKDVIASESETLACLNLDWFKI